MNNMSDTEKCGDYEIFRENDWWIVKNILDGTIVGKFLSKEDALDKVAKFLQDDIERTETESVC